MNKYPTIIVLAFAVLFFGCAFSPTGAEENVDNTAVFNSEKPLSEASPAPTVESKNNQINSAGGKAEINFLSFANGAEIVKITSELNNFFYSSIQLIDGSSLRAWSSDKNQNTDQTLVLELPAKTTFKSFVFDSARAETGTSAKNVMVEVSDSGADSGFQKVLETALKERTNEQKFTVSKEIPARWVRLTIKNNYGSPASVQLGEFRGYGEQENVPTLENIGGTYKTNFGNFHVKQDGTSAVGCFDQNYGVFEGGIEGRVLKFIYRQGKEGKNQGKAVLTFSKDVEKMDGLWSGNISSKGFTGRWTGTKTSSEIGNCPHMSNLDGENAVQNSLENTLDATGRAVVYGINFDFNSDKIKEESKPTLENIVEILKKNSDWKMTVEGHTDNIGGESFNQTLSEKRAASVRKYLTENGINESRLNAVGRGMSQPIGDNESDVGRAQNRRVEIVKQ